MAGAATTTVAAVATVARVVAVAALAGCLPEGAPPWKIDHAIVAAIRVDIAEPGPYGPTSPRPDRLVAAAMPGDKIRFTPFLIGPDGPLDAGDVAPAWFYCQATRCFDSVAQPEVLRGCATEPLGPASTCRIGTGATATLQLGELSSLGLFGDPPSVFMVSGTPGGASTARCLERLRNIASATESLRDCILIVEPLPIGPVWRLFFLAAFLGLPDAIPLDSIPIEAQSAEPSLYPEVRPFEVTITASDGEARELVAVSEDTVAVAPGDTINIRAPVDPFDAQLYYRTLIGGDGLPVMQAQFESFSSSWLLTDAVDEPTYGVQEVTWEVPAGASGEMYGYYLLSDTRSVVWGWLRFELSGVSGVPGVSGS
ncbi:MAG TPA: hypothetical protein VGB85_02080 [Nannocystis sp.]